MSAAVMAAVVTEAKPPQQLKPYSRHTPVLLGKQHCPPVLAGSQLRPSGAGGVACVGP